VVTTGPTTAPRAVEAAPAGRGRFEELEAFRGIAAALIVVFHAYQYSRDGGGAVWEGSVGDELVRQFEAGVSWFFVLSAFLLYLPIARAVVAARPAAPARAFLKRRAVRIVPLYLVAVTVVWALRNPTLPGEWRDLVEHLTFTQIYDSERIFFTIGPAWSLAVEVHFYLLLAVLAPALGAVTRRAGRGVRVAAVLGVPVLLGVGSTAFRFLAEQVWDVPSDRWAVWFSFPAKLDGFALGMLLAGALAVWPDRQLGTAGRVAMRLAALPFTWLAFQLAADTPSWRVWFHLLSAVAALLVIGSSVLGPRGTAWERALSWKPLATLGVLSYSLYLWHEPVLLELADWGWLFTDNRAFERNAVALLVVSLAVAFVSYWVIEWPASQLRHLFDEDGRPDHRPAPRPSGSAPGS